MSEVIVDSISKQFRDGNTIIPVLSGASLQLRAARSLAITGESGSGKSTLLHLIGALDAPDTGSITIDNQTISSMDEPTRDHFRKHTLGFIFQRFNLIDCLSVWDNVCLPQHLSGHHDNNYAAELLEQLGLLHLKDAMPATLSGGEQQRVAIGRALSHRPALVLADEPTGNLDDSNSQRIADLLFSCCDKLRTSLILVTHSNALAAKADKIMYLSNGTLTEKP